MFTGAWLLSTFSAWKPALGPGRHSLTLLAVRQGGGVLLFPGKVHLLGSERLPGRARNKLGCLPVHSKAVIWREGTQQDCGEAHLKDQFVQLCVWEYLGASWSHFFSPTNHAMRAAVYCRREERADLQPSPCLVPGKICASRSELGEMLP